MFDNRSLESIRSKAAAVQTELEAMNRGKNRSATSTEQRAIDAAASIDDLIIKARNIDTIASDLPNLLLRLKTLESTHLASNSLINRIDSIENIVNNSLEKIKENGEVLTELKQNMITSISTFKENINEIDLRIKKY